VRLQWQNNPLYQAIVQGIDQILGYVDQLCPSAVTRALADDRAF
jgi:hypothetical protein